MTNETSPRPWRVVTYEDGSGQCDIYDANGTPVCTMGHFADKPEADAELIVDAVNERDRLRDALERIVRYEDGIVGCIESGHASGIDWDGITFAMIQEARAAIGEGETPMGKGVGR